MFEIEQKYRISNPAPLRRRLTALGAKCISRGTEKNELWDYAGLMKKRCAVLRLRSVNGKGLLTFKGPRLKSRFKKRREVQTPVDVNAARELLKNVGFRIVAKYQKFRQEYRLRSAHVTLDRLSGFGWFVEIEANPRDIQKIAGQLGLTRKDREDRTYLEMVYGPRSVWRGK